MADVELGELVLELVYFVVAGHLDLVEALSRWASKVVEGGSEGLGGDGDGEEMSGKADAAWSKPEPSSVVSRGLHLPGESQMLKGI